LGQENLGLSSIGGSRVIQHWQALPNRKQIKEALSTGKVDVLTMAPIFMPDEGIKKFAVLALENNPEIRITVQEDWLWRDTYEQIGALAVKRKFDYDAVTGAEIQPGGFCVQNNLAQISLRCGRVPRRAAPARRRARSQHGRHGP